jgi:hypothetical protein
MFAAVDVAAGTYVHWIYDIPDMTTGAKSG